MHSFLDLPERTQKPRSSGITHVLDKGLSLRQAQDLVSVASDRIDIVKLGWGTAVITKQLEEKLDCYRSAGIDPMLGGTLTELAIMQDKVSELTDWLTDLGIHYIEISDGTLNLPAKDKLELITELSQRFMVLSEVGSKDAQQIMAPYRWVEQIKAELAAGSWRVVTESRETGTAGIYRDSGEVRMGLIDEIVHAVDQQQLIFEAPQKQQQVWFLKQLGHEVNLGNIAPEDVISLETLRLGLRADTLGQFGPEAV